MALETLASTIFFFSASAFYIIAMLLMATLIYLAVKTVKFINQASNQVQRTAENIRTAINEKINFSSFVAWLMRRAKKP